MNWYFQVLQRYAQFSGRARRAEYWWFTLFNIIVAFVLGLASGVEPVSGSIVFAIFVFVIATIIPSIAVSVRRLHDTGRSGWWCLITFIPLGSLVLLYFWLLDSQPGENRYGPNPKEETTAPA